MVAEDPEQVLQSHFRRRGSLENACSKAGLREQSCIVVLLGMGIVLSSVRSAEWQRGNDHDEDHLCFVEDAEKRVENEVAVLKKRLLFSITKLVLKVDEKRKPTDTSYKTWLERILSECSVASVPDGSASPSCGDRQTSTGERGRLSQAPPCQHRQDLRTLSNVNVES
eukprot:4352688-Amphidinium_carterae.1